MSHLLQVSLPGCEMVNTRKGSRGLSETPSSQVVKLAGFSRGRVSGLVDERRRLTSFFAKLQTWKSPLQRWAERQRLLKLTSHNVKEIVLKPPSEQELHLTHECAAAEKALKKQGASGAVAAEEA